MKIHFFSIIFFCMCYAAPANALDIKYLARDHDKGQLIDDILQFLVQESDTPLTLMPVLDATISNPREEQLIRDQSGAFNTFNRSVNAKREKDFLSVPFPLFRGLLGNRVAFIHQSNIESFASIKTMADLKKIVLGQGRHWMDTQILKHNNLTVYTPPVPSLIRMINRGRIDAYPRGLHEIFPEFKHAAEKYPYIRVDKTFLLSYKLPAVFYVSKNQPELRDALARVFLKSYENGKYQKFFATHPQVLQMLEQANIDKRVIFELENPFLPTAYQNLPDHYWLQF